MDNSYITNTPVYAIQTHDDIKINNTSTFSKVYCSDIIVGGHSLTQQLEDIKQNLLVLTREKNMEAKYPELKEAYDNYQRILNTLLAMETLTGDNNIG